MKHICKYEFVATDGKKFICDRELGHDPRHHRMQKLFFSATWDDGQSFAVVDPADGEIKRPFLMQQRQIVRQHPDMIYYQAI